MKLHRMYALSLRHIYLIKGSLPRILDLIYWPTIQIVLWGFISKFFTLHTDLYNHAVGIILSSAILYDFLFRSSISFNMLFLEEIWSRNFTNLFVAPLKVSEIYNSSHCNSPIKNTNWNSARNTSCYSLFWCFYICLRSFTNFTLFKFVSFWNYAWIISYFWTSEIRSCF